MSLIIRRLMRDPLSMRPISRALRRRFDDDWWDELPVKRVRRSSPMFESPFALMDDMSRQMNEAIERMHDIVEDLHTLDQKPTRNSWSRRRDDTIQRTENGGLQLALDVSDFKPSDLKIKLVDDNLLVEASAESSGEDSYQKSHFKRWFKLPEGCNLDDIKSRLTTDNRLLIDLPSNKPLEQPGRNIPIEVEKPQELKDKPASESGK